MAPNILKPEHKVKTLTARQSLTPHEYFMFAQVGEGILVKDLIAICPWTSDETMHKLEFLLSKGVIGIMEESGTKVPTPEGIKFDVPTNIKNQLSQDSADQELLKLDPKFREEVLYKFDEPTNASPYDVLEINPKASNQEIRDHYLNLSRKYHPDRFFRKKLGHYKPKLDWVFTKIQRAYAVLKNPIQREALDRTLNLKSRPTSDPKKPAIKLDPQMEKIGKAEHHFKSGSELEKAGDILGAYNHYLQAAQLNPQRDQYQKSVDSIRPRVMMQKAHLTFESIKAEFDLTGSSQALLDRLDAVSRGDQAFVPALVLKSRIILDLNLIDKFRDAKEMLLRAKAQLLKDAEPCYQLGRLYVILGESKSAKKELEEALLRNPKHLPSKKLLEKC